MLLLNPAFNMYINYPLNVWTADALKYAHTKLKAFTLNKIKIKNILYLKPSIDALVLWCFNAGISQSIMTGKELPTGKDF